MTLTVTFDGPWRTLPWASYYWGEGKDKALALGIGPLHVYITGFSPVAEGNTWRLIAYNLLNNDEHRINQLNKIATSDNLDEEFIAKEVRAIK